MVNAVSTNPPAVPLRGSGEVTPALRWLAAPGSGAVVADTVVEETRGGDGVF